MEKQGVIRPDLTPPEHEPKTITEPEKCANSSHTVDELDNDFRKRAAGAARIPPQ